MRILLSILPYWDPMIPPMGITTLKRFLEEHGHIVKTVDLVVDDQCLDLYNQYFYVLREIVPVEKQGNFFNFGHDVLQSHLMAFQNVQNGKDYNDLVSLLVYNHYYSSPNVSQIKKLNAIIALFYEVVEKRFTEILESFKPDVVGVTAYKCTLPLSLFALKLSKKKCPNVKTIMGGGTFNESHAPNSPNFEKLLNYSKDYLDNIFIGPSELMFLKYLRDELPKGKRIYTKSDINGEILCFEDSKIPDFSDLDLEKYPCMAATASVGCIYNCSFCVSKKVTGGYRSKDTKQLLSEMNSLYKMSNTQLFFMTDSLINPVIDSISEGFINSPLTLYFDAYMKVSHETCDIENTLKWRRGGLYRVRLGAESGSLRVLNEMNKGITTTQIKETLSALAFAGIKTTTYWVIGHPGETEEDFMETLNLIEEMKDCIFQAECNYFLYHYSQQGKSDEWADSRELLYPEKYTDMLVFQYWKLNIDPLREETFKRVHRFEAHCRKCGIPNPYTLKEHYEADIRWKKLHSNAVPPLLDLYKRENYIDDCKGIKEPMVLNTDESSNSNFVF